jgi:hypothetical protein
LGLTSSEPKPTTDPAPVSVAETAFVDDQERSELLPSVMVGEFAVMPHEGVVFALPPPPPPKPGEDSETPTNGDDGVCADGELGDATLCVALCATCNVPLGCLFEGLVADDPETNARVVGPK